MCWSEHISVVNYTRLFPQWRVDWIFECLQGADWGEILSNCGTGGEDYSLEGSREGGEVIQKWNTPMGIAQVFPLLLPTPNHNPTHRLIHTSHNGQYWNNKQMQALWQVRIGLGVCNWGFYMLDDIIVGNIYSFFALLYPSRVVTRTLPTSHLLSAQKLEKIASEWREEALEGH